MNYIKSIFDERGFSNIWDGQTDINNCSRGEYDSKFKTEFKLENYLLRLNAVYRTKLKTSGKE